VKQHADAIEIDTQPAEFTEVKSLCRIAASMPNHRVWSFRYVRYRHKADMPAALMNVRYRD
jgi:hypothetical protein